MVIGQTLSHYRILEKLGEGGMGVVYLAEDTVLGRKVAIKMLKLDRTERHNRARFLREARAVSALNHPNIATIFDYGETADGEPYLVMEYVDGPTLAQLLADESLTIARSVEIISRVAEALSEAHEQGFVHRDIKPSNIAINDRGMVKVLDFGLAKQVVELGSAASASTDPNPIQTQTRDGLIVGTPSYLSPEQARGELIDHRSDIFALGSVLYECVTGRRAFDGENPIEVLSQIIRDDPPAPSSLNVHLSDSLNHVILKLLARKPDARFQTCRALLHELASLDLHDTGSTTITPRSQQPAARASVASSFETVSEFISRPRSLARLLFAVAALAAILMAGSFAWRKLQTHRPPKEAQSAYAEGIRAQRDGNFFSAEEWFREAVRLDDKFLMAHLGHANALIQQDAMEKARSEVLRATQLADEQTGVSDADKLYLQAMSSTVLRQFDRAIDAFKQLHEAANENEKPLSFIELGRAYQASNDLKSAIECYSYAIQLDPQLAPAYLALGVAYRQQSGESGALASFTRAEELFLKSQKYERVTEVLLQRGSLFNSLNKTREATQQLQQALEIIRTTTHSSNQKVRALFQLGSVAYTEGRNSEAEQLIGEALETARSGRMENLSIHGLIELGNNLLSERKYREAQTYLERGANEAERIGATSSQVRAESSLASIYSANGKSDKALSLARHVREFYQALGATREIAQAHEIEAQAQIAMNDFGSAVQSLDRAGEFVKLLQDESQLMSWNLQFGYLQMVIENYPAALGHFEESVRLSRNLRIPTSVFYAFSGRADMLWRVGKSADLSPALSDATEIANQLDGIETKRALSRIQIINAMSALSERRFADAVSSSQRALSIIGREASLSFNLAEAKRTHCLGLLYSGQRSTGRKLCRQALSLATSENDPYLISLATLALAEAELEVGESKNALARAVEAVELFERAQRPESCYRARLVAAIAADRLGYKSKRDALSKSADETLRKLETLWKLPAPNPLLSRPDIAAARQTLGLNKAGTPASSTNQ